MASAYLEICSLRRDLSDEFKGHLLRTPLPGFSLPGDLFSTPGPVRRIQRTFAENSIAWHQQTLEYDLMRDYRATVPEEEQEEIWEEVGERLEDRDKQMRKVAAKRLVNVWRTGTNR